MGITEEMQRFLVSAYFGDVDSEDKIREACVDRAYLDLARRIPYRMSSTYIENNKEKEEVKAFVDKKTAFRMSIKEYLKEQKESNVMDVIEQVHIKANNIEGLFKEKESFYIGLAQKWVNMTFKYFWLFGISPFEETQLHVPLDSYILHAISDKDGKNEHGLFLEDGKWCNLPWSTIESLDQYKEIQKEIANGIKKTKFTSAISWENSAWIEQAKIEA